MRADALQIGRRGHHEFPARPLHYALRPVPASGFCGLLYQVVWLRLAFAAFGVITPVLSIVLSVFMFGLSLGSWRAVDR